MPFRSSNRTAASGVDDHLDCLVPLDVRDGERSVDAARGLVDGQDLLVAELAVGVARYAVGTPSPFPLRVLAAIERIGRGQQAAYQVGLRPGDTGADLFAPRLQGDASQRLQGHLAHVEVGCRE
jgi:hypothetical protein